jgi:hypothetical protein
MKYLCVPKEVSLSEMKANDSSWSAGMYHRIEIPTKNIRFLRDLLVGYDKGCDPGSRYYLGKSTHYFIRTKALQSHSYLICPKGEAVIPLNPLAFKDMSLKHGDILLSKDSNVGECAMVDGPNWENHTLSGGIVRLRPSINAYYLFAFLKHPLFISELRAKVPRGATIAHAKELWLDCRIPFPSQNNSDQVISYVAALTEAILDKERCIRDRDAEILRKITEELENHQSEEAFQYTYPSSKEVSSMGRLDAAVYGSEYKSKVARINRYQFGSVTPAQAGFTITPGPSLEMKLLLTRIDSQTPKPGFYTLLIPSNISEYGTMSEITWLGTAKNLPLLRSGDILFGEAGFHKGRSIVLLGNFERATTNAHGLYARRTDGDLAKSIFFRCIFNWYRHNGLIDLMAVGGSGGHFSPEYFDFVRIPAFPKKLQEEIVSLYHNPATKHPESLSLENFVEWHSEWNGELGITQLDHEMRSLQEALFKVQQDIIEDRLVSLPFQ